MANGSNFFSSIEFQVHHRSRMFMFLYIHVFDYMVTFVTMVKAVTKDAV